MVRRTPDDEHDRQLLGDIDEHGWHLVGIEADSDGPGYVFSVGIYHTLGQPEICIFGLSDGKVMGQILNTIGELMRQGQNFADWVESDAVCEGYPCVFRAVDRSLYAKYFGYARWYYEGNDFSMLQCVWPDRAGRFPWDNDFDAQMVWAQPVLADESEWPFFAPKNLGVITTRPVLDDGLPILLVTHDDDGDWQFLCNTTNETSDGRVVGLVEIVNMHPGLSEVANLPRGWQAFRESPSEPWQQMEQE